MKNPVSFTVVCVFALVCAAFCIGHYVHKCSVEGELRTAQYYSQNHLTKSGATMMVPGVNSYTLRSFDGGKNWYAIEMRNQKVVKDVDGNLTIDHELIVLGKVDDVYPGLLAHLEAVDRLMQHVEKNGPVTGKDAAGIEMLGKAGFTVK